MYADELFWRLKQTNGRFFKVTFRCRCPRVRNGQIVAPVGRVREMLCRLNVNVFKRNIISDEQRDREDLQHAILTCWDVQEYFRLRGQGMVRRVAGRNSYRRINLAEIQAEIKDVVSAEDLPITLRDNIHRIKNGWQREQLAARLA